MKSLILQYKWTSVHCMESKSKCHWNEAWLLSAWCNTLLRMVRSKWNFELEVDFSSLYLHSIYMQYVWKIQNFANAWIPKFGLVWLCCFWKVDIELHPARKNRFVYVDFIFYTKTSNMFLRTYKLSILCHWRVIKINIQKWKFAFH